MLDGDDEPLARLAPRRERGCRPLDAQRHVTTDERERLVRAEHAWQQSCLAEDLEAVADAEHGPALRGEGGHRRHHRREAGDRPATEVVAVREAARQDDAADARGQPLLPVPDEDGFRAERAELPRPRPGRRSSPGRRRRRSSGAARSRLRDLDLVALDQRVREQLLAHPLDLGTGGCRVAPRRPRGRPRGLPARSRRRSRGGEASPGPPRPCGSRIPCFGRTSTVAFIRRHHRRVGEVVVERDPGEPLERLDVARARPVDDVGGQLRARAASCPSPATRSSRGRTACRRRAVDRPARTRRRARSGRSPA